METLVGKLRRESKNLDEYQRAQVLQALVAAKQKLTKEMAVLTVEELNKLEKRLVAIEKEIGLMLDELDLEKVGDILSTLSLGMRKLLEKSQKERKGSVS